MDLQDTVYIAIKKTSIILLLLNKISLDSRCEIILEANFFLKLF